MGIQYIAKKIFYIVNFPDKNLSGICCEMSSWETPNKIFNFIYNEEFKKEIHRQIFNYDRKKYSLLTFDSEKMKEFFIHKCELKIEERLWDENKFPFDGIKKKQEEKKENKLDINAVGFFNKTSYQISNVQESLSETNLKITEESNTPEELKTQETLRGVDLEFKMINLDYAKETLKKYGKNLEAGGKCVTPDGWGYIAGVYNNQLWFALPKYAFRLDCWTDITNSASFSEKIIATGEKMELTKFKELLQRHFPVADFIAAQFDDKKKEPLQTGKRERGDEKDILDSQKSSQKKMKYEEEIEDEEEIDICSL